MPRPATPGLEDRILGAAGRLFYAHGVQAVAMAQIVAEAGCGKNALYRLFPSKDDLVVAFLQRFGTLRDDATDRALEGLDDDPRGALVALVAEVAKQAGNPAFRGCSFRNYLRETQHSPDDEAARIAGTWLRAQRTRVDTLVERLPLRADVQPGELSDDLWLVVDGVYGATLDDASHAGVVAVRLTERLLADAVTDHAQSEK